MIEVRLDADSSGSYARAMQRILRQANHFPVADKMKVIRLQLAGLDVIRHAVGDAASQPVPGLRRI